MQELKSKSRVVKLAVLAKKLDENIMLKYKLLYSDLSLKYLSQSTFGSKIFLDESMIFDEGNNLMIPKSLMI